MLIIDGPDNIGKSTLAHKIVEEANKRNTDKTIEFRYRHMTRPPDGWDYFEGYKELAASGMYTVQDRFHLGTLAYDETPGYTREQLRIIESWVYSTGSMTILLLSNNYRNYEARLRSKEYSQNEMFYVNRILRASTVYEGISNGYFEMEDKFGINPTIDYCYDIKFDNDGKFCTNMNGIFWKEEIPSLVEEWFKRIEWAVKGKSL